MCHKARDSCLLGFAKRGYCSMLSALVNSYSMNGTEVRTGRLAACRVLYALGCGSC